MFKKFAFLMALAVFGFCFYSLYAVKTPVFAAYADEYELYLTAGSFGNGIVYADAKSFAAYKSVKGESCTVTVSYEQVLKDFNATHLFSEKCDAGENFYAYSAKLPYRVYVNGVAVNIHYFKGESANKVGTPIIFGSY